MQNTIIRQHFLLDVLNDKSLISIYFTPEKLEQYTNTNFLKLKEEYESAYIQYQKESNSKIKFLIGLKNKIKNININNINMNSSEYVRLCANKILSFNDILMCALYLGLLTKEDALKRGFKEEYLDELIEEAKQIIINQFVEKNENINDNIFNKKIYSETNELLEKTYLKGLSR